MAAVDRIVVTTCSVIPVGRRPWRWVAAGVGAAAVGVLAWFAAEELQSSRRQARWLAEQARELRFELRSGANPALRVPAHGPFDERLGYTRIPLHVHRLADLGYVVAAQAWQSPALVGHMDRGLFAPFHEKTQAGLSVLDCRAQPLYENRYPQQAFAAFDEVPPLLAATLSFVEDRGAARRRRGAHAQPGDRSAAAGARRIRPGAQACRCRPCGRRRQHAGHADREVPPLARGAHHRRRRDKLRQMVSGLAARLRRRRGHERGAPAHRARLRQHGAAGRAARLRRGERPAATGCGPGTAPIRAAGKRCG